MTTSTHRRDLICFSHLRWHFVTQRPQHLLSRAARDRRVFVLEEPIFDKPDEVSLSAYLEELPVSSTLTILRPHPSSNADVATQVAALLRGFLQERSIQEYDTWYYTPIAWAYSAQLQPRILVYDCMDELKNFLHAPPELVQFEQELLAHADVVFTGGRSLYEHKRASHPHVFAFPSSIDRAHFQQALSPEMQDPSDQALLAHPRAGFYGVIDERFDTNLLRTVAELLPLVQFVMLGPVVKIDASSLPKAANIHYLGGKSYDDLPAYLSGWDVALLPFAKNESTRFISPTKTPEYLAAGKPVVSTPIHDVVSDYGEAGLVEIAGTPEEFAAAIRRALQPPSEAWRQKVAAKLNGMSWDDTWNRMQQAMDAAAERSSQANHLPLWKQQKSSTVFGNKQAPHLSPITTRAPFLVGSPKLVRSSRSEFDVLVVGAGFAGAVLAERLASQLGKRVLVVDKRSHIAGNAYDYLNEHGILVHRYGPHIFHTNSSEVVTYLSQFTEWHAYEHRVLACVHGKLVPLPINCRTLNELYDLKLNSAGMEAFLAQRAVPSSNIRTSKDLVLSRVGQDLYETFFRNYTLKQWGLDPADLDASVAGRIPVRFNNDDRYFSDSFQAMPLHGYTRMFERMLEDPRIMVQLGTSYDDVRKQISNAHVVFTGPIDEFFGFRFGHLPYRSLEFQHQTHNVARFQPACVVNYPNENEYTRITEFKYMTGQSHAKTSIVYEYPRAAGDPYYPIPRPENTALYEKYKALADAMPNVTFCGRLANYRYFNMDQVVAQALRTFARFKQHEALHLGTVGTRWSGERVALIPSKQLCTPGHEEKMPLTTQSGQTTANL